MSEISGDTPAPPGISGDTPAPPGTMVALADAGVYEEGIPYAELARLRAASPVAWIPKPGYWAVTRYADVEAVSRDQQTFSSFQGTVILNDLKQHEVAELQQMLINMDPPEHTGLRRIVSRVFTPKAMASLGASITANAVEVVDRVAGAGAIDFVTEVAAEMPLLVLADVLGIPREDRHLLFAWTNKMIGPEDPEYGASSADFKAAMRELFDYASEQTARKRRFPGDDLWSLIVNSDVGGRQLNEGELERFFQLLVVAGNETTRNHIVASLWCLSLHPDQWAEVKADSSLLPDALEESLRWWPPIIQFRRTATRDCQLGGQGIAKGERVVIYYPSANRDEAVFADPDRFDLHRRPNPHLSFGAGPHYCLGAGLARFETQVLLAELFRRVPDLEVTGQPVRLRSNFINGIRHLPVVV